MLSVIVNGVETSLDNGALGILQAHDGWGMSPLHRITERGPQQHGETDIDYRLDPRFGNLVFMLPASTLDDMYNLRNSLINLFAPQNNPILKFALPYGTRQFDVHYVSDLTMPWNQEGWAAQKVVLTLKAPDPTCYDPASEAFTFALGGGAEGFVVPMPVPHGVGASVIDQVVAVNYGGNFLTYPSLIRITGPITNCVITNETTGEKLDFTGITITAGDYYDLDLRYGSKTVVNSTGVDKIADLTDDSDHATFHIAASPEAPGGINSIRVTGSGVTSATKIELTFLERHLGI